MDQTVAELPGISSKKTDHGKVRIAQASSIFIVKLLPILELDVINVGLKSKRNWNE